MFGVRIIRLWLYFVWRLYNSFGGCILGLEALYYVWRLYTRFKLSIMHLEPLNYIY